MHLRAAALPLLAAGLVLAPAATAQTRGGTLPEEFVRAVFPSFGEEAEIVVGRLPPGIPREAVPSGSTRVIGGFSHPRAGTSAVVVMPGTPEEALAAYGAQMERAGGWKRVGQQQPSPQGAFISTWTVERTLVLCGDAGVLRPVAAPRKEGGSYLRLMVSERTPACDAEVPARGTGDDEVPFPEMQPMPGARTQGHGGGTSSSYGQVTERNWEARIETSASPADIAAHYAAEMRRAGWTVDTPAATPGVAAVTAETRDAQGRPWRGVVTVVAKPGSEREAQLRVMRWTPR